VLVIGAGPAGLTAAYELAKANVPSVVLEADDQVGGLSRTVVADGYRFDIGGHRFFSKVALVNDIWHELLAEELLERPRRSRIFYSGRFFEYPLQLSNALRGLGALETLRVGISYLYAKFAPHRPEVSFEHWVSNRFGARLFEIFFKTYTEKVWGIPCSEISADWAAQRIKNLSLTEAVRAAILGSGRSRNGAVITTLIDRFQYPRLGPGMMWERCVDRLAEYGTRTLLRTRVERVAHHDGFVTRVVARNGNGVPVEWSADHVISTMPLRELIESLDPPPPPEVMHAANQLRYRDYLTVVLIVNRAEIFPDNWIYIHSPEVKVGRIQNYKNWSPEMVPDASRTSLGLEYFLSVDDEEWQWSNERWVKLATDECVRLGLVKASEVERGVVVRAPKAYPVYDHGYTETLATLQGYVSSFKNLHTVGRNGLHRYNNQDHSMLAGVFAARNVLGGRYDVWSVNTEQEYHESGEFTARGDRLTPSSTPRRSRVCGSTDTGHVSGAST
jgi:protoporphyrinogen oxidase